MSSGLDGMVGETGKGDRFMKVREGGFEGGESLLSGEQEQRELSRSLGAKMI